MRREQRHDGVAGRYRVGALGRRGRTKQRALARRERAMAAFWVMLLSLLAASGCTRAFWRNQADCCVYMAVNTAQQDPQWQMRDFTINIRPTSRLYDPTNPDRPPMPPDDPTLHQFMHCVNCMHGFPCWHQNGDTPFVANPLWQRFLPIDGQGNVVVDAPGAVQMGILHSRDYQENLEQLYLSALDVTFERFRFVTQVFADNATFYTADGELRSGMGVPSSVLNTQNNLRAQRLFGAGGTLVADVANTFVWQFAGTNNNSTNTLVDFTFVQPLLQYAGRARVMERLTFAERAMVANVRQMQRYRQGFYVSVYTGRGTPPGPTRRGGAFGGAGLEGFSGIGSGGFGRVGGVAGAAAAGGNFGAGAAQAGGYLGLLQNMQEIENQEANVAGLRDSTAQMEAAYEAGRIDRFQVDFSRQAMYNAESVLLTARAALETDFDNFKILLGLPPDTPLKIEDPVLERFRLIDLRLTALQFDISALLDLLRADSQPASPETLADYLRQAENLRQRAAGHINLVDRDFENLDRNYDARIRELDALYERGRQQEGDVDPAAFSSETFRQRVAVLKEDFAALIQRFDDTSDLVIGVGDAGDSADFEPTRLRLVNLMTDLSAEMAELSLVQARAKLDAVTLNEVNIDPREAFTIARDQRPDLRNARAGLVDSWRLVEFNANALQAGLDLVFNGDLGTARNNPVSFNGDAGRLQVGMRFDAPLTRVQERNLYRQSLIEYQQARRSYMLSEDQIYRGLRLTLRTIELNKLNFELRRGAVLIAIDQVDLTRLRLTQPPRPGETSILGNTTARDLVDSLAQLLNVQNQFLSVWVNFEVQRLNLDFDMGTMQIDSRGIWLDPGPITGETARRRGPDCRPVPLRDWNEEAAAADPEWDRQCVPSPLDRDEELDLDADDFSEAPLPGEGVSADDWPPADDWDHAFDQETDSDVSGPISVKSPAAEAQAVFKRVGGRAERPEGGPELRAAGNQPSELAQPVGSEIRIRTTPPGERISTTPRLRSDR